MSAFDTSRSVNMEFMFAGASSFNHEIGFWNTSQVTNMRGMFQEALSFNKDIGLWNTSGVTNMEVMFKKAHSFNQNISAWDDSALTNSAGMFDGATGFRAKFVCTDALRGPPSSCTGLNTRWIAPSPPPLAQIRSSKSDNLPLTDSNLRDAIRMCLTMQEYAYAENGLCAASMYGAMPEWDISSVTSLREAFSGLHTFNADISSWDTSQVTDMYGTFSQAHSFNAKIGRWNTSRVENMRRTFLEAWSFDQDISSWNTFHVNDMGYMFYRAHKFSHDVSIWTGSAASITQERMFFYADSFQGKFTCDDSNGGPAKSCKCNANYCMTDVIFHQAIALCLNEAPLDGNCAEYGLNSTKYGYMPDWDVSRVTNISRAFQHRYTFNADISRWNLSAVTDISWLFNDARAFNQDISGWDVSRVQHMQHAFEMASAFNFDISEWNDSSGTDYTDVFLNAVAFQARFDCTDSVDGPPSSCTCNNSFCLYNANFRSAIIECLN